MANDDPGRAMVGRGAGVRAIGALCAAVALVLTACGDDRDGTAPSREATASRAPSRPVDPPDVTGAPATATAAAAPATGLPEGLLGRWTTTDGFSTTLDYAFERDGTYKHIGVLVQQRDTGVATFTRAVQGTVRVRGRRLVLRPRRGTTELQDPDVPSASRPRPIRTTPERYTWALTGRGAEQRLTLTGTTGSPVEYRRP